MKTREPKPICNSRLKLPIFGGSYYIKKALKLEQALAAKPKALHLEMIGEGEIPADTALLIRSILFKRLPETQLEKKMSNHGRAERFSPAICFMSRWPSSPGSGLQNRPGECNSRTGLQLHCSSIGVERYTLNAVRKDLPNRNTGSDTQMLDHFLCSARYSLGRQA